MILSSSGEDRQGLQPQSQQKEMEHAQAVINEIYRNGL